MKKLIGVLGIMLALFLVGCSSSKKIVSSFTPADVQSAVAEQEYEFVVQFVQPAKGRVRNMTGGYSLMISKDKIKSVLPYFGVAYSAPMGANTGGLMFESKDFDYTESVSKKGVREIAIKIKDSREVQDMFLSISDNGSADLRVTPLQKQFISYRGDVRPIVTK